VPGGRGTRTVVLTEERVSVGRLAETNDISLEPDTQLLVGRTGHCTLVLEGGRWYVVDGGSVNGTFVRRGRDLHPVHGRAALHDGDVVCILGRVTQEGARSFFELAFHSRIDPQATRAAPVIAAVPHADREPCLSYEADEARLVLVRGDDRREIEVRAQVHRLVRHMVERNDAIGGSPALCTHDELMHAVWEDEPFHTREELAKLVWELRRKLEPLDAGHLVETERRRGYRLRTCAPGARA